MKNLNILFPFCLFMAFFYFSNSCESAVPGSAVSDTIPPQHKVTLPQAHVGDLEVDTRLLDSYGRLPQNIRQFYLDARSVFSGNSDVGFTHPEIIRAAQKYDMPLMGGPMLGKLSEESVVLWFRPSTKEPVRVKVTPLGGNDEKSYRKKNMEPGVEQEMTLDGLSPDTEYEYVFFVNDQKVTEGEFTTAPVPGEERSFRLAFGSCFHKIGLHNPNLIQQILEREPGAMMLLGDIAVDDREDRINMHLSDYLLRDVSKAWRQLAANVSLYTSWDDHDYFNNDLSGIPDGFTAADVEAVREVYRENWNNPSNAGEGIYFNTRIGPVEIIMLDTRSCRENDRRHQYASYLGEEQLNWFKNTLKNSTAPFKVISSGTMWSDYMSNAKDTWGSWDIEAREEIFDLVESENISGVLLISGDRHGARGFTIPRPSGFEFYEFEAASLGGVPGPDAMAKDDSNQLFGYHGTDAIAFGEFTFEPAGDEPSVTFRLIDQTGTVLEEHNLPYDVLTPDKN